MSVPCLRTCATPRPLQVKGLQRGPPKATPARWIFDPRCRFHAAVPPLSFSLLDCEGSSPQQRPLYTVFTIQLHPVMFLSKLFSSNASPPYIQLSAHSLVWTLHMRSR